MLVTQNRTVLQAVMSLASKAKEARKRVNMILKPEVLSKPSLRLNLQPNLNPNLNPEPAPESDRDFLQETEQEVEQHPDEWPYEDSRATQHVIAKSCDGRPLMPISRCLNITLPGKRQTSEAGMFAQDLFSYPLTEGDASAGSKTLHDFSRTER